MKINLPVDTTTGFYKHIIKVIETRGDNARLQHDNKWWKIKGAKQTGRREVTLTLESIL
jgi:hypothetical protein